MSREFNEAPRHWLQEEYLRSYHRLTSHGVARTEQPCRRQPLLIHAAGFFILQPRTFLPSPDLVSSWERHCATRKVQNEADTMFSLLHLLSLDAFLSLENLDLDLDPETNRHTSLKQDSLDRKSTNYKFSPQKCRFDTKEINCINGGFSLPTISLENSKVLCGI